MLFAGSLQVEFDCLAVGNLRLAILISLPDDPRNFRTNELLDSLWTGDVKNHRFDALSQLDIKDKKRTTEALVPNPFREELQSGRIGREQNFVAI